MGKKIHDYTTTRATLLAADLLDIDATDDGGTTWDSQKVTYNILKNQIGSDIGFSVGNFKEIPFVNSGASALQYSADLKFDNINRDLVIVSTNVNIEQGIELLNDNLSVGGANYPRFRSSANGTLTEIGSYGADHVDPLLKQKSVIKSRGTTLGMVFITENAASDPFEWRSGLDGSDLQMSLLNGTLTLDTPPALDNTEDDVLVILTNGNIARRSAGTITGAGDMLKATYDPTAVNGDAFLRSNMSGTQVASTISDFDVEVANNAAVTLNTAKLTNANHSGDVSGSGLLTAQSVMITGQATVTGISGDFVLISDTSDAGNLKKVDLADLLGGASLWTDDTGGDISHAGGTVKIIGVGAAASANPAFRVEDFNNATIMEFLDNRTGIIVSGNTINRSEMRFKEGFIEIIKAAETQTVIGAGTINQLFISGASNTMGAFSVSNSLIIGKLNILSATGTIDSIFLMGNSNNVKEGNFNFVSGSSHIVNSGNNSFAQGIAITIGGSKSMGVGNNIAVNNDNVFAFGDGIDSTVENTFLVGRNLSINTASFKEGVFFGHSPAASTFPSISMVYNDDPTDTAGAAGRLLNFGMGSIEIGRHNNTQGAARAGAGAGIMYLSNDGTFLVEPPNNVVNAVGMWAKDRIAGKMGLLIKAEDGTKHMISDRVGINIITPTSQLHVDQASATGEIPVLHLDQADVSEEIFEITSTAGVGNAVEAVAAKTLTPTEFIKITLNGVTRHFQVGTIA